MAAPQAEDNSNNRHGSFPAIKGTSNKHRPTNQITNEDNDRCRILVATLETPLFCTNAGSPRCLVANCPQAAEAS